MKKIVCLILFLMVGFAAQVQAGQIADALAGYARKTAPDGGMVYLNALCSPFDVTLPGPYGGACQITGSFCGKSGTFNMIYSSYQLAPELACNGSITVGLEFDSLTAPSYVEITMNGGPLDYTYQSQAYLVYYDNVVARLDVVTAQLTAISGNVIINNQTIPLDDTLADLLIL